MRKKQQNTKFVILLNYKEYDYNWIALNIIGLADFLKKTWVYGYLTKNLSRNYIKRADRH